MQRKLVLGAALALLLALISVSFAFASGNRTSTDHGGKVRIIHVITKNNHETDLDLGAKGPSVGDRFSVFSDVFQNNQRVGVGGYECVTLLYRAGPDPNGPPAALTDQCVGTFSLAKGQITVQGWWIVPARCRSRSPSPAAPAPTAPLMASCKPPDQSTNRVTSRSPEAHPLAEAQP
jgi:hypothetical protein